MDPGGPSPLKHAHRFAELEASVHNDPRDEPGRERPHLRTRTLTPGPVRGSLTSRLLVMGTTPELRTKVTAATP